MDSKTVPFLLVTANVGSIFEDPEQMLKLWADEFLATVSRLDPKFIALHCQEVGGKNYEKSMKHVQDFINLLTSNNELRLFDRSRIFLDEDYSSAENFTALGNLYFIHESIKDVLIWDFKDMKFAPVEGKELHTGNIETVVTKEKAKFPQDFFPECKWSRKGFMRTRWSLQGTVFDMINIHLFHDASNFVAMEEYPSVYCKNRRRALEHTLQRFHNDSYGRAPYFLFGDFNFRTDTDGVIKKLTEGLTTTRIQNNKNGDFTKLQYTDDDSQLILTVGKKEFRHSDHQTVFLQNTDTWLKQFDKEAEAFENYVTEFDVGFPPSYPFEENVSEGANYMVTRCPSWCDRVLLSHSAKHLVNEKGFIEYGLIGRSTCMGDHKPVYLRIDLKGNAGTIKCCSHAPYDCLPVLCHCCQLYASVTINVTDMSDYLLNTRKSFDNITVDSNFLHEPITREMLLHDPYTPESVDSHSPGIEKAELVEEPIKIERNSVSPHELKTKLEDILRIENAKSRKFLMRRSASQNIIKCSSPKHEFRDRAMSDLPQSFKAKLKSETSASSSNRLQSHHSSSDEDWFEFDEILECKENYEQDDTVFINRLEAKESDNDSSLHNKIKHCTRTEKRIKSKSMKDKFACCCVL
uniref:inositol-polyphosphate 5-phosphatase n=1 Tax=Photinus pyralis TaxID=7054 RepID=A0A1Y1KFE9_PHOPY